MSAYLDSTAQTGQSSGGDWQEQVYPQIESMKESYLPDLNETYQKIATQLQQHNSLPTQPKSDQIEKMKLFKALEPMVAFLHVSKSNISPNFKEKLGSYDNQIINFINRNRHKKTMPPMQSRQLSLPHIDWQEEVYQKIKSMKESYLPELNEMYQKAATKLRRHTSLPQQPKSYKLEKYMKFIKMLDCVIAFLHVSKSNVKPNYMLKLDSYQKQIINIININRPKKTMPPLQYGQFPPPHMHSISQSQHQVTHVQSHENPMNSQLQTTNMQGSVAATKQNNMTSMQHIYLFGVSIGQQREMDSMQPITKSDSEPETVVNCLQQISSEFSSTKP